MEKITVQEMAMFLGCDVEYSHPEGKEVKPLTFFWLQEYEEIIESEEESFKPILRPISNITEEEMKELYLLVFKRPFVGDNITHRDLGMKCERYVLWSGLERLFIYKDGDVEADSDLVHYKVHRPTVLKWMILKQFDVFGWIEKGLAIDKTKL
jgi:hypothetical protein